MWRFIIAIGCLILTTRTVAQTTYPALMLPDSIIEAEPDWVDFDNDGLLDVMLILKSDTDNSYLGFIKGDTINPLSNLVEVVPIQPHHSHVIVDYNKDNRMDILLSEEKPGTALTFIYLNVGAFRFDVHDTNIPAFTNARFADLNNDATPELLVTGEDTNGFYFEILKQLSDYTWSVVHDSLKIKISGLEVIDANGDGQMDLFISGKINPDSLFSGFLINEGEFYFKPDRAIRSAGYTSTGDLNADGLFDVVLMGIDENGLPHTKKFQSSGKTYTIADIGIPLKYGMPFIADFNYDGAADIQYYGVDSETDTINVIQYSSGTDYKLPSHRLSKQRFGDVDHDGNLDLLQLIKDGGIQIVLQTSLLVKKNEGPRIPLGAVALPVFDRVFMYWEKPGDDHTPNNSLTFDVHLSGAGNYQPGDFDLLNEKRLTVTHGNNGTSNFKLLKNVALTDLKFSIQAIDNSFHSGRPCYGEGSGQSCVSLTMNEISACTSERVSLAAPENALWFSFAEGFLGTGGSFDFTSEVGDTIFYYHPKKSGCPQLVAWAIGINNDTIKVEKGDRYACSGSEIIFSVEEGWDEISWTSQLKGNLGTGIAVRYPVDSPDSVFATLSNSEGCKIIRKTAIRLSKPDLNVPNDHYKIIKGSDVQLNAEGAQRYRWTPDTQLTNDTIPNPLASPLATIKYTVTGYDSLGCFETKSVDITVEETGFIPSLFSPNDDDQNDQLKIYGIASAHQFTFNIFDRNGTLVYKTSDLNEAMQRGWDGTKNGTKQPAGVYFWKVSGVLSTGPLLLNGKDAGSVVLIR